MSEIATKGAIALLAASFALSLTSAASANIVSGRANRTAQGADQSGEARNPNRRICAQVSGTGSRLSSRVCKTRAQWLRDEGAVPGEGR